MSQSMIERAKRSSSSCDAGAGAGASAGAVGFMALVDAAGWNTWGGGHVRVCGMNRFRRTKAGRFFFSEISSVHSTSVAVLGGLFLEPVPDESRQDGKELKNVGVRGGRESRGWGSKHPSLVRVCEVLL